MQLTSETPLSDLMERFDEDQTDDNFAQFVQAFRHSTVGVVVGGVPEGSSGQVTSTDEHPLMLGSTEFGDGQARVLAFADPHAFAKRFGAQFNAGITGEAVFHTVLSNPDCHGVLVNNAKAEKSILIRREYIESAVQHAPLSNDTHEQRRRPRWQFWRHDA